MFAHARNCALRDYAIIMETTKTTQKMTVARRLFIFIVLMLQLQTVAADGWWTDPIYVRQSLTLLIPDWESVWSKYSNNGTLGVEVYLNDVKLESYECAVYDSKGEQRECKSSLVDQGFGLGRCLLTINGDLREEMHFKVAYDDAEGVTRVASVEQTFSYYTNCAEVMRLDVSEQPSAFASLSDGSTYDFTAATCTDYADRFPSTTSIIFTGDWTEAALAQVKTMTSDRPAAEMNPNCLYFFPAHLTVPDGWRNAVKGGKALTDINLIDGQYPFLNPMDFDLNHHRATYTRNWSMADGKSGWNTLCVPFKAKVMATRNDMADVTVPPFASFTPSLGDWARGYGMWLCRVEYANTTEGIVGATSTVESVIEANSPYLITFPGQYFQSEYEGTDYSLDMTACTIYLENLTQTMPKTPTMLVGSWQDTAKDDYTYQGNYRVLRSQNMWLLKSKAIDGMLDAFVRYSAGNLLPFRAFLSIPTNDPAPAKSVLGMSWLGDADGIEHVMTDAANGASMFDINGMKIRNANDGSHRIVIRSTANGKNIKTLQR